MPDRVEDLVEALDLDQCAVATYGKLKGHANISISDGEATP